MTRHRHAFSLIELSIVLVILGLLVGGILAGQSLIHASELRAVGAEYQKYLTATHAFRDKYFALPGDMANATNFWGTDPGGCPATANNVIKTATCNGDGDGQVDNGIEEMLRFWQHLANAGLIDSQFTGAQWTGGYYDLRPDINTPQSKFPGAIWSVRNISTTSGNIRYWGNYNNHFQFGKKVAGSWNDGSALTPEDAWNLDKKIDDGLPASGFVVPNANSGCTNSANAQDYTGTYNISVNDQPRCYLHLGFERFTH